jgi:nucleoside-diphosphate-sugar epimerase
MGSPRVVAVTGANGYVGSLVVRALADDGVKTVPLVRKPRNDGDRAWSFEMSGDELCETLRRESVTHVVHAAWDMTANSIADLERTCVAGTERLVAAAQAAAVQQCILISTISAYEGARSAYGRSKLTAEKLVLARGGVVLRLGLVWGEGAGGMMGRLRAIVSKNRVVPVIGGSKQQYLLHESSLAELIRRAVGGDFLDERRVITAADPDPISLSDLLRAPALSAGRNVVLIPVPWQLAYLGLRFAEVSGVQLGFRSDSLISFIYQNPTPDFTPLNDYPIHLVSFVPRPL